ncbi:hypothetical protein NL676_026689 [Syzygium grande]|nr:hypothetical protein NL676_026689 [Syzygium grande]
MPELFPFSSGNVKIKVSSGIVHSISSSSANLPVGRKPHVFVLAVPDHMTNDGLEDGYSVLIRMDDQI